MGIIERTLADFELIDGTSYTVEYNDGDTIHIHVDSVRIEMSTDEFRRFVAVVADGHETLLRDKNLEN